ncbi:hypothetical protein S40293_10593 [Stachybotrys chartarum IBT 40293]|nr:hypothetical protein S40293_10593 [Stachybotrys chartarum IBT 40293]
MLRLCVETPEWSPTASAACNFDTKTTAVLGDGSQVTLALDSLTAQKTLGVELLSLQAMLKDTRYMPLGVDVTKGPSSWTLGQVAELVQFDYLGVLSMLHLLTLEPCQPAHGGHNLLWHAAGGPHFTTLRLDFVMAKDVRKKFGKWLGALDSDLEISSDSCRDANFAIITSFTGFDTVLDHGEIPFAVPVIVGDKEDKTECIPFPMLAGLKTGAPNPIALEGRDTVVFFIAFDLSCGGSVSMKGKLWCAPRNKWQEKGYAQALPDWEKDLELRPSQPQRTVNYIGLKKLLKTNTLPRSVPTEVSQTEISVKAKAIIFKRALVCRKDTQKSSEIPVVPLDRLYLYAKRSWGDKKKDIKTSWEAGLEVDITLNYMAEEQLVAQLDDPMKQPCQMRGAITYRSGSGKYEGASWRLEASVEGLTLARLAQFWSADIRDGAIAMLSHIEAEYVKLKDDYGDDSGEGSSFMFY